MLQSLSPTTDFVPGTGITRVASVRLGRAVTNSHNQRGQTQYRIDHAWGRAR